MKSDYYVKTQGVVIEHKEQNYVVSAKSKEDAELQARQLFEKDYVVINDRIGFKSEKKNNLLFIGVVICLLIPVVLSYIPWVEKTHFFLWETSNSISIAPHLKTTLFSIIFYSAFVLKFKGLKVFKSPKDVVVSLLMVLIFASFFEIVLKEEEFFFGLLKIDPVYLIIIAILLSWGGEKLLSCACYIAVAFLAVENINDVSIAMGSIWGTLYIVSSYFGIGLYFANDYDLRNSLSSMLNFSKKAVTYVSNDLKAAKAEIDELKSKKIK